MALNGKQRRALRALGHHLEPVVQVGKDGISESLVKAIEQALQDHELIKIKVGEGSPIDRHEVAEVLEEAASCEVAQVLGRTLLLFKRNPEEPKIELPGLPLPPKAEKAEKPAQNRPGSARARAKRAHPPGGRRR